MVSNKYYSYFRIRVYRDISRKEIKIKKLHIGRCFVPPTNIINANICIDRCLEKR